ncbi:PREDICTED: uncharacterized protein LOC109220425 [Nicotiana attenuata]|uniref:uncharacterized protein LOC109220425 n=1 Tax=Nicotiana attenuata TaxID=49451 RepID=UPI000904BC30|nr:PREDICTED: uncharacterized protein LOC109220425 [Nicotiana attenuata]
MGKILTGRPKLVVDQIVGELQKGYSQKSSSPRCLIKVDIRKTYDSVEWSFLEGLFLEFGFPTRLAKLTMECVSTVRYSLLINGGLTPRFDAKKGLRQGDPMSPNLLVLLMENLNRALKQLKLNPDFNNHPKCVKKEIVHISFADDLLMCYRADLISIQLKMKYFGKFSEASSLKDNMEKSSIYLVGVSTHVKEYHANAKQQAARPSRTRSTQCERVVAEHEASRTRSCERKYDD